MGYLIPCFAVFMIIINRYQKRLVGYPISLMFVE